MYYEKIPPLQNEHSTGEVGKSHQHILSPRYFFYYVFYIY